MRFFAHGSPYALRRQGGAEESRPTPSLLWRRSHSRQGKPLFGWRLFPCAGLEGLPRSRLGIGCFAPPTPLVDAWSLGAQGPRKPPMGFCPPLTMRGYLVAYATSARTGRPTEELPASSSAARCSRQDSCLGRRSCRRAGLQAGLRLACCHSAAARKGPRPAAATPACALPS
jgi:hypothetical protein